MKKTLRPARRSRNQSFEGLESRAYMAAHIAGNATNYATIQAAVNAATPGATITVDAGTYNEAVVIDKTLTLKGAQAGVDGRATRGAESIINTSPTGIKIWANDVTIDGFTVQGTKANIGAGLGAGIYMAPSIHGTHVFNNVIKNNVTGLYLSNNSDTDAAVIQRNYFSNNTETGSDWTYGWNGSRAIYTDGEVSGGFLTNVLIDSNKFYRDDSYTGEGMIALAAGGANKQFNITISRNVFQSPNSVSSKAILVFNTTNLSFIGNDASGQNDTSSGPVRFEGNADNVNIQYNSIHDNAGPGVAIDSAGVEGESSGFVVRYNNIYNNRTNNIGLISKAADYIGSIDATNNWWGNATGPSGQGKGTGQAVWGDGVTGHYTTPTGKAGGDVKFSPWATALVNIAAIPVPLAATGLAAVAGSSSSVTLTWTATYSTATSQLVQRSTDGTNFSTLATISPLVTSFTDAGASSGQKYYYRVIASNFTGNAVSSNVANATPAPYQPPVAPNGLTVKSTTATTVSLAWVAPANAVGVAGYRIYRNGTAVGTATGTTYTDANLTAGTTYTYAVATVDNVGAVSAQTTTVSAATLVAPTWTSVSIAGSFNRAGIVADGTKFTTGGYDNAGYALSSNLLGSQVTWNGGTFAIGAAGANNVVRAAGQTIALPSVSGTTLSFLASAVNGNQLNQAFVIRYTDGTTQTATQSVTDWATATRVAGESTVATMAYRNTAAGAKQTLTVYLCGYSIALNPAKTVASVTLPNNTNLNVVAVSLYGVAPKVPAAPLNVTASGVSTTQVALAWQAPGTAPTSYTLQRSTDGINFANLATNISGATTAYTDGSGLSAGTKYYYRLIAVNAVGSSPASAVASATTLSSSAIVTPLSSLNWTTATAGYGTVQKNVNGAGDPINLGGKTYASGIGTHSSGAVVYNLAGGYVTFQSDVGFDYRSVGKPVDGVYFQVIGDGKVLYDSGAVTDVSRVLTVSVDVTGVRTLTLVNNAVVAGEIDYAHVDWAGAQLVSNPIAPAAPTNLTAAAVGTGTAQLAWSAAGTNQTGFKVDRSANGGTTWTTVASPTGTTYVDAGLAAGTTYSYRVRAVNAAGESPNSSVVTFAPVTTVTTYLSDLNWTSATSGYATVQKNVSVKGNPISLRGTTYAKGLGTHAVSTITYDLGGKYATFASDVGVDDAIGVDSGAAVIFRVYGDGVLLYDSGVLTRGSAAAGVGVSVAGVRTLTLVATNGVAGTVDFDHADWAGARLLAAATAPAVPMAVAATATSTSAVTVTWSAGGTDQTAFRVERSADNGATWAAVATPAASATSYADVGLTAGTTYSYRVLAINSIGTSVASSVATARTLSAAAVTTALSSLNWTTATTGFGEVVKDGSMKGNAITLGGTVYTSGIGAHAESTITYDLSGGTYASFLSDVGVDDEVVGTGTGSAVFRVYGDGVLLYDSGVVTSGTGARSLAVSLAGVRTLTLVAAAAPGGDIDFAHADWAGARLITA